MFAPPSVGAPSPGAEVAAPSNTAMTSHGSAGAGATDTADAPKTRRPYTLRKPREKWSEVEHQRFVEAVRLHGRAWSKIEAAVGTKTAVQIRSHAQKWFGKLQLGKVQGEDALMTVPPPRPKQRSSKPATAGSSGAGVTSRSSGTMRAVLSVNHASGSMASLPSAGAGMPSSTVQLMAALPASVSPGPSQLTQKTQHVPPSQARTTSSVPDVALDHAHEGVSATPSGAARSDNTDNPSRRELAESIVRNIATNLSHWATNQSAAGGPLSNPDAWQSAETVSAVAAAASTAAMAAATAVINAAGHAVKAKLQEQVSQDQLPFLSQPLSSMMPDAGGGGAAVGAANVGAAVPSVQQQQQQQQSMQQAPAQVQAHQLSIPLGASGTSQPLPQLLWMLQQHHHHPHHHHHHHHRRRRHHQRRRQTRQQAVSPSDAGATSEHRAAVPASGKTSSDALQPTADCQMSDSSPVATLGRSQSPESATANDVPAAQGILAPVPGPLALGGLHGGGELSSMAGAHVLQQAWGSLAARPAITDASQAAVLQMAGHAATAGSAAGSEAGMVGPLHVTDGAHALALPQPPAAGDVLDVLPLALPAAPAAAGALQGPRPPNAVLHPSLLATAAAAAADGSAPPLDSLFAHPQWHTTTAALFAQPFGLLSADNNATLQQLLQAQQQVLDAQHVQEQAVVAQGLRDRWLPAAGSELERPSRERAAGNDGGSAPSISLDGHGKGDIPDQAADGTATGAGATAAAAALNDPAHAKAPSGARRRAAADPTKKAGTVAHAHLHNVRKAEHRTAADANSDEGDAGNAAARGRTGAGSSGDGSGQRGQSDGSRDMSCSDEGSNEPGSLSPEAPSRRTSKPVGDGSAVNGGSGRGAHTAPVQPSVNGWLGMMRGGTARAAQAEHASASPSADVGRGGQHADDKHAAAPAGVGPSHASDDAPGGGDDCSAADAAVAGPVASTVGYVGEQGSSGPGTAVGSNGQHWRSGQGSNEGDGRPGQQQGSGSNDGCNKPATGGSGNQGGTGS